VLEGGPVGGCEGAEYIRSVVERELARHRVTPISSSTNLIARTA
jgi:hypothetical protein